MNGSGQVTAIGESSRIDRSTMLIVSAYVAAIIAAEALALLSNVAAGLVADAILVAVLITHYVLPPTAAYRRLLPALALVPLLRILSLTMPVRQLPQIYWYVMVGVPLLLALGLTIRLLGLTRVQLGMRLSFNRWQLLIGLSGLVVSLPAYLILHPRPLVAAMDLPRTVIDAVILALFVGFSEELLFRGVLQRLVIDLFGTIGIVFSSLLFAAVYFGSLSLGFLLYMGLIGVFFAWTVNRTQSLWGVILAHSLLSISLLLIWPYFLA